jgi:hypothetical protein
MVVGIVPHSGGIGGSGLNMVETQAHMSMWVMASSPLFTCNDVRKMSDDLKEILTNAEVLAVHKDPAARMAVRIDVGGGDQEEHSSQPLSSTWSIYGKVFTLRTHRPAVHELSCVDSCDSGQLAKTTT